MAPYDIVLTTANGVGIDIPAFTGLSVSAQIGFNNLLDGAAGPASNSNIFYSVALWKKNWIGTQPPSNWGGTGHPTWATAFDGTGTIGEGAEWVQMSVFRTDACATGTHDCHEGAECEPVVNSFTCTCNPGYTGDGKTGGTGCANLNECDAETHNCPAEATCQDTTGSFDCDCPDGSLLQ